MIGRQPAGLGVVTPHTAGQWPRMPCTRMSKSMPSPKIPPAQTSKLVENMVLLRCPC